MASTGVIGVQLDPRKVTAGHHRRRAARSTRPTTREAARAIMTTDPFPKESAVAVEIDGRDGHDRRHGQGLGDDRAAHGDDARVPDDRRGGRAGAAAARPRGRVRRHVQRHHRRRRVLDQRLGVPAGERRERRRHRRRRRYAAFVEALRAVCLELALGIVRGGEGATKLVTVTVTGAATDDDARQTARAIANSPLVKTAIHGGDPNWGRLVAVAGRAGARFELGRRARARRRRGAVRARAARSTSAPRRPPSTCRATTSR